MIKIFEVILSHVCMYFFLLYTFIFMSLGQKIRIIPHIFRINSQIMSMFFYFTCYTIYNYR